MIELEKTYLAKDLPEDFIADIENGTNSVIKGKIEIIDIYLPYDSEHPKLRIRKNGDKYEMTKKEPVDENDVSIQNEQTINLSEIEFDGFLEIKGRRVEKMRYLYEYNGRVAEIDIFTGDLKGLVLVDFEFDNIEDKDIFDMPSFCLVEVTQEDFIAGGLVAGKKYSDLEYELDEYGYKKIIV